MGGIKSLEKNEDNYYIWIDLNIKSKENSDYAKILSKLYKNLSLFTNVKEALMYLQTIKFKLTYIIISGSLFLEYIYLFKNIENNISTAPKLIIFTSESTKEKLKYEKEIKNSFYNIGGLAIYFEEVEAFLNKNIFGKELDFVRPLRRDKIQTGGDFSFQIIENKDDLNGPINLNDLIIKPNRAEFKAFDKYLIDNYGDIMNELISQIFGVDCPDPLRIKYWLRAYTLETKFYKDMNNDLMKEKSKLYLPYSKLLYSGLKSNSIKVNISNDLYRGALISKKELGNLINLTKNRKNYNIPFALIYCKSFMSFSLEKNVALDFMNKKNPDEKTIRVLYILESKSILDKKNVTNADLDGISYFENEKEILLFPFSIYEISNFVKKNNYYEIYLSYLAKYKEIFKMKNQTLLYKSIFRSKFVKELQLAGLSIPICLAKKCLCKITIVSESGRQKYGSGFFCSIPLTNTIYKIPVLITANHVLNEENIKNSKQILIEYGDNGERFILTFDKESKIYTHKEFDITIIKIEKKNELFNKCIFMEIDEDTFENEEFLIKNIRNKKAYILEYAVGKPFNKNNHEQNNKFFQEFIEDKEYAIEEGEIKFNGRDIEHNIPTNRGASGGPIISGDKFKVIGYHLSKNNNSGIGYGNLLKYPINEFINIFYH